MLVKNIFPLLALASIVAASPSRPTPPEKNMRLVKISEDDAGTWVTEDEKFDKFISKHIHFVDITETWVGSLVNSAFRHMCLHVSGTGRARCCKEDREATE